MIRFSRYLEQYTRTLTNLRPPMIIGIKGKITAFKITSGARTEAGYNDIRRSAPERNDMNTIVEKRAQMTDERARRLERLAAAQGITPDALIEQALDLLFQRQSGEPDISESLRADWELLQELEAELGSIEPSSMSSKRSEEERFIVGTPPRFDLTKGTVTHTVPVAPGTLKRTGEER
jgi:hypothetical protein